ncbi:MAG: hypothetical protein ACKOHM_03845 [Spartobacteria bacterium]
MESVMVMQGRELKASDIEGIRGLLQAHPEWNRTRLSRERPPRFYAGLRSAMRNLG